MPTAEVAEVQTITWTPERIQAEAEAQARAHHLNVARFVHVMELESSGWQNIQSNIPDKTGPNGKEDSWGICQIHLPDHPKVTRDQALDPSFCLTWSAREWQAGNASSWTEYRINY